MLVVVTGGASSGKSAYAEWVAMQLPGPHAYLAAMSSRGAEAQARIARHVKMREGKGFVTYELAEGDALPSNLAGTALLEDLGNVVANGLQGVVLRALEWDNLVVVANEVGCDGVAYEGFTAAFVRDIGKLACELSARADMVVEVIAGVPCVVKGGEVPWAS